MHRNLESHSHDGSAHTNDRVPTPDGDAQDPFTERHKLILPRGSSLGVVAGHFVHVENDISHVMVPEMLGELESTLESFFGRQRAREGGHDEVLSGLDVPRHEHIVLQGALLAMYATARLHTLAHPGGIAFSFQSQFMQETPEEGSPSI